MSGLKIACFLAMYSVACATTMEPEPEVFSTSMEPEPGSDTTSVTEMMKSTTSMKPTEKPGAGECVGNDSRCASADMDTCKGLGKQGSDCKWVKQEGGSSSKAMKSGECTGNDSRCADSKQSKCIRLKNTGSSCTWTSAFKAGKSAGTCAGNDSRCPKKSKAMCKSLGSEGADCKWREAFSAVGSIKMKVTNADDFLNDTNAVDGVKEGISNVTAVPKDYIEIDVHKAGSTSRLLSESRALNTQSDVIITYVITLGADAPADIVVTSDMVNTALSPTNVNAINTAIVSKVEEKVGANNNYAVAVEEVPGVEMVVYVAPSGSNSTTAEPEPDMSTTSVVVGPLDDGAMHLVAPPLLALIGSCFYVF